MTVTLRIIDGSGSAVEGWHRSTRKIERLERDVTGRSYVLRLVEFE